VVERIYGLFLNGHGLLAIAEHLTRHGIPCPSAHDPGRNSHRSGIAWSKGAVRAILTNPRYTGRQVWNKQRKDEVLLDVSDVALGHTTKMRWNDAAEWIYSEQVVHPPLISDDTFAEVQQMLAARSRGQHKPHRSKHDYALRGLLVCGLCDRRMQGHWANGAPYYRITGAASPPSTRWPTMSSTPTTSPCARTPSSARSTHGCPASSTPATSPRPSMS
jgi:site-specific DNA recombinase